MSIRPELHPWRHCALALKTLPDRPGVEQVSRAVHKVQDIYTATYGITPSLTLISPVLIEDTLSPNEP